MVAAVAAVCGFLAQLLTSSVARFIALKVLLMAICCLVLPVVLNNLFYDILETFINVAQDNVNLGTTSSIRYALTGVGAYWGSLLRLPECLSIILSACAVRLTLRLVRLL